jgi:hypothetical protein
MIHPANESEILGFQVAKCGTKLAQKISHPLENAPPMCMQPKSRFGFFFQNHRVAKHCFTDRQLSGDIGATTLDTAWKLS